MLPVIAIIGRPNVGKSTLFNRLTKSRDALVADLPGLTRDRQYGEGILHQQRFIVVDTGGIGGVDEQQGINSLVVQQTRQALQEADAVLFVVDGRAGRTAADEVIASQIRTLKKSIYLVVNKTEGINPDIAMVEFHAMGLGKPIAISAAHGDAVNNLMELVLKHLQQQEEEAKITVDAGIKIAIIGRPNVGKSTLVNRILGEERVIVYDQAGTTRDSIFIPFERRGQHYTIIDTAGVRRRGRVLETVEKFSVIKALQAIKTANVVVFVIDAREGLVDQDLHLLGFVLDAGISLVIAINKWDGLNDEQKQRNKSELQRRLQFVDFAKIHTISALHGTGVGDLFGSINKAYASATKKFSTNLVSKILENAVAHFSPPLVHGRRVKLRYAHLGGHNPPIVVIHGNQTDDLPMTYKRYLAKFYREKMRLVGTPIKLQFKNSENPYAGKKNPLTDRQKNKRRRLLKHVKKG